MATFSPPQSGTAQIADDAVTAAKIAAGAVGASEIATDAVEADEIAAGAVGASEIATGAVDDDELAGGIPDSKLDTIATAGKVSGAALTLLANIPAAAGVIPAANVAGGAYSLVWLWSNTTFNPADSTTYYQRATPTAAEGNTSSDYRTRLYVPKTGTVSAVMVVFRVDGTLGSGETFSVSIRKNDTTSQVISAAAVMSAATNVVVNSAMTLAVTAGDFLEIVYTTPAWATNPLSVTAHAVALLS